jgi:hypothetical protein
VVSRRRTLVLGGLAGAVLGFVLGPRRGETRRAAAIRLRLALRGGRGSVAAFSGTPCAAVAPSPADPAVPGRDGDADA